MRAAMGRFVHGTAFIDRAMYAGAHIKLHAPGFRPSDIVIHRFVAGADIRFRGPQHGLFADNSPALLRTAGVAAAEVAAGTTRGPFPSPPLPVFVVNPISMGEKSGGS